MGSLQCFPDLLAKFKGIRKEQQGREWVKYGWKTNGRRERGQGRKRNVRSPSNFPGEVAPVFGVNVSTEHLSQLTRAISLNVPSMLVTR